MTINRQILIKNLIVKDKIFSKKFGTYIENVVQCAHWTCKIIDDETKVEEKVCGSTYFQYPEDEFISYNDLTKRTILSWIENHPDIDYKISLILERFNNKIKQFKETNTASSTKVLFESLPD